MIDENESYQCMSTSNDAFEQLYTISKLIIAFALPYSIIIVFSFFLLRFLKKWSISANKLRQNANPNGILLSNQTNAKSDAQTESLNSKTNSNNALIELDKILIAKKDSLKSRTLNLEIKKSLLHVNNSKTSNENISYSKSNELSKLNTTIYNPNNRRNIIKRRTTRFVLAIVFSFLCCWSPLWIFTIIMTFADPKSVFFKIMSNITMMIVYLGGVINPLLYMFLTQNFREYASEILRKFKK